MRVLALLSAGSVLAACSPALIAQDSIAPRLGESAEGEGEVVIYDSTVLLDEKAGLLDLQVGTDELVLLTDGTPMGISVGNVVVGSAQASIRPSSRNPRVCSLPAAIST